MYSENKHSVQTENRSSITLSNIKGTFERDGLGIRFDASFDRILLSYLDGRPLLQVQRCENKWLAKIEGKSVSIEQPLATAPLEKCTGRRRSVNIYVNPEDIKAINPGYELALVPELTTMLYKEPDEEGRGGIDPEGRGKIPGDFGWGVPLPENEDDGNIFRDIFEGIGEVAAGVGFVVLVIVAGIFGARECEANNGKWRQQPDGSWLCEW